MPTSSGLLQTLVQPAQVTLGQAAQVALGQAALVALDQAALVVLSQIAQVALVRATQVVLHQVACLETTFLTFELLHRRALTLVTGGDFLPFQALDPVKFSTSPPPVMWVDRESGYSEWMGKRSVLEV